MSRPGRPKGEYRIAQHEGNTVSLDLPHLAEWIGREEQRRDVLTAAPVAALAATLDRDDPAPRDGDPLPPLAHWLYFLPLHRQSELGPDGHARRGGFLPPVPLPRRMWAGGRLDFVQPLRVGEPVVRNSRIVDVRHKAGRSGDLVFVLVRHQVDNAAGIALVEEHDIVYRDAPQPGAPAAAGMPAPAPADWQREIVPDDVLLFRYSALTFNGHRIHYDRRYVTTIEGYPGLVVHGPLQATLLLDLVRRELPSAAIARFEFKAVRPVFDSAPFRVCGRRLGTSEVHLWVEDADCLLAMAATARLA
jgi:3-methylfumaryl-CoA hydratase